MRLSRFVFLSLVVTLLVSAATTPSPAAVITADTTVARHPRTLQLYPRDLSDSCTVNISGAVTLESDDSVHVDIYKNNIWIERRSVPLRYVADFSLEPRIGSELSEYRFHTLLNGESIAHAESVVCGDGLLIKGQSNAKAEDYDSLATETNEWVRSFGSSVADSAGCAADSGWAIAQGHTTHAHGAVGVWGLRLGGRISAAHETPVCLINGALGATRIEDHQRDDSDPASLTTVYGRLLHRADRGGVRQTARTLLWHQGEANTNFAGHQAYADRFAELRQAWKEDYPGLERFYVFQLRPGCGSEYQNELREIQRLFPDTHDDVSLMSTAGLVGHDGCHFGTVGYNQMADWVYPLLARDLHGAPDSAGFTPPDIESAFYSGGNREEIVLQFDQDVIWPADTLGASMVDYFYLDGNSGIVDSGYASGNEIVLRLAAPSGAESITYLPNQYYEGSTEFYRGPWIRNVRGIGALSFHVFPVADSGVTSVGAPGDPHESRIFGYPNPSPSASTLSYSPARAGRVSLKVYDTAGQLVDTLVDEAQTAGRHQVEWRPVVPGSGVYFYRFETVGEPPRTGKLVLLK